ncbi:MULTISPECIES: hypothetical protein [Bacillus cereus group]|uniref:hypothetical protein n=1 Tax=Bacillus cereus group TaxID=86661 RepID=UPI0027B8CB69|nr:MULTISPECIES: hypothetical protein [Bacillus cereus group]
MEEQTSFNNERLEKYKKRLQQYELEVQEWLITLYEEYEYDIRQSHNLFDLDSIYKRMSKKSFVKSRKQEFEILMMYCWFHDIENDEQKYWREYLTKALT